MKGNSPWTSFVNFLEGPFRSTPNRIRQFIAPPIFPDDENKTIRAMILSEILFGLLAFLIIFVLATIFILVNKLIASIMSGIMLASLLISHRMLHRGHVLKASIISTLGYWFVFVLMLVLLGTIKTPAASLMIISIIMAGTLISLRFAAALAVLSSMVGLGVAILETTGHSLPHILPGPALANWTVWTLSLYLIFAPLKIALQQSAQALARARQSEKRYKSLYEDAPVMYLTTVEKQNIPIISSCNLAFLNTLGYRWDEVVGQPLENFYTPESRTAMMDGGGYQRLAQDGKKLFIERDLVSKDGEIIHTMLQATPEIDQSRQVIGVMVVFLNITQRKKAEIKLRANETLLRNIAENYPNSYLSIIEKDLRVGFTSGKEFKKRGLNPKDFVGRTLEQVFGEHAPLIREKYLKAFEGEETEFELFIDNQYQLYHVIPLTEDGLRVDRILSVAENITERKQAEDALRTSETRLKEAQSLAHIGSWELDLETDVLVWSDEIYRIFELEPQTFEATYEAFLDAIHPDDREMVNQAYTNSLKEKMPYTIDHRLLMKDGSVKFVHEQCETWFDQNGQPIRSVGTVQDITEHKKAEIQLHSQLDELRRWQRVVIGREERILALKREINTLCERLGEQSRYPSAVPTPDMK